MDVEYALGFLIVKRILSLLEQGVLNVCPIPLIYYIHRKFSIPPKQGMPPAKFDISTSVLLITKNWQTNIKSYWKKHTFPQKRGYGVLELLA